MSIRNSLRNTSWESARVLGDRYDKPEFIETLPQRGYQFVAAVRDEVAPGSQDLTTETSKKMVGRDTPLAELHTSLAERCAGSGKSFS